MHQINLRELEDVQFLILSCVSIHNLCVDKGEFCARSYDQRAFVPHVVPIPEDQEDPEGMRNALLNHFMENYNANQ